MHTPDTPVIVITGATGGIGLQSALGLARTGARVLITGRNPERADAAVRRIQEETGNPYVESVIGDLSSVAGVDALEAELSKRTAKIDVLVNNAGYLGERYSQNTDGYEMHFAMNVVAPWRLSYALLPLLQAADAPRIVNVTGGSGTPGAIDPDNLQAEKGFKGLLTYGHSKSALEALSMAMAQDLESAGITVNVVFPGRASTEMTRSLGAGALPGVFKLMYPIFKLMFKEDGGASARKAAQSTIWAASAAELDGCTGKYFDTNSKEQPLHESAYDAQVQARILETLRSPAPVA